eukprot:1381669-Prymnesium_polylepis.1
MASVGAFAETRAVSWAGGHREARRAGPLGRPLAHHDGGRPLRHRREPRPLCPTNASPSESSTRPPGNVRAAHVRSRARALQ